MGLNKKKSYWQKEKNARSKATEQQAMMCTGGEGGEMGLKPAVRVERCFCPQTEVTHAGWHVSMLSSLGYDDTPKENTWEA